MTYLLSSELGSAIGILIAIIIGAIVLMCIINKILDWLSIKFPIGYNVFLIISAGITFAYSFIGDDTARAVMYIISTFCFAYCLFTRIEASHEIVTKRNSYFNTWGDYHEEEKEEEVEKPAWVVKLGLVLFVTIIGSLFGLVFSIAWLALILEAAVPIFFIINEIRHR